MDRIRVCHLITRMIKGGAQKVVLSLIEGVDRRRFDSSLLTGPQAGEEGTLLEGAGSVACDVCVIPDLVREIDPLHDLRALAGLCGALQNLRPDILHCHTYKAGVLGCYAGRLSGVRRVVFSPHGHIFDHGSHIPGVPSSGARLSALYWLTRSAQMCADAITAVSPSDMESQVKLRLAPRRKYVVIPNGISLDERSRASTDGAKFRKDSQLDDAFPLIGAVGRLSAEKGHRYLIAAVGELRRTFPRVALAIVGKGALEAELRSQVAREGLDRHVRLLGYLDDVAPFLAAIDLYVQPSLYESQGLALIEAMMMQKPVIATEVGGVRDVVEHRKTGLLVPSADPSAIASAVVEIAGDGTFAPAMAEEGRRFAERNHGKNEMIRAYERLYEHLVEEEKS